MTGEAKNKVQAIEEKWPVEVVLSINDRLWLLNIISREGDVATLRLVRELREELSFSDKENEEHKIQVLPNGAVVWDKANTYTKTLSLGRVVHTLIADTLQKLNTSKKLNLECIDLYSMFCDKV